MNFEEWKKLLSSSEPGERSDAAEVLPDDGERREVAGLLLEALHDEDYLVRACAAETLGQIDLDEVRSALRSVLETEANALASGYIASSLGEIGELSDLKLLVDKSSSDAVSCWVKLHCAQGIAAIAVDHAAESMIEVVSGPDWKLRSHAFKHLETSDFRYALAGNAPIVVTRDGVIHETGTALPLEKYLERFE